MTNKDFGIRDGEKAVELPAKPDAGLYFIGRIHTPWKERKDCPKNARESEAVCTIEVDPAFADGLKDVETCSHLVVLYWMDKAPRNLVLQVPGHYGVQHGTFALRSPARPNPVAMSVVKLLRVEGNTAFRRRPRLPRRHPAHRHQALFRLHRQRAGGGGRLAQAQRLTRAVTGRCPNAIKAPAVPTASRHFEPEPLNLANTFP